MNDLVTGDAVVLELRLARLASRAIAFGIDLAVMAAAFLLLLAVAAVSGALGTYDNALTAAVGLVLTLTVFVAYPVTIETLTRGRSLGKMALGLRVVREDGGPIRFRHALTRGLTGFVVDFGVLSLFTGVVGLISSLISVRGRRVGDMLAGTVVVRERMPTARAVEVTMPAPLAGWATSLTLSQLPDALALSARQFLQRAAELDPHVRVELGSSLAGRFATHVSPAPPPGTPAEAFLAAVLAERRRRDGARLAPPPDPRPPADPPAPQAPFSGGGPARHPQPPGDGFALPR